MAIETFNVGDRVTVEGSHGSQLYVAEVLKGQYLGQYYLRYNKTGAIVERDGEKKRYHRSLLTKVPEALPRRSTE